MSSEESEEEGGEEPPKTPVRPPRPQAVSEGTPGWGRDPGAGQGPQSGAETPEQDRDPRVGQRSRSRVGTPGWGRDPQLHHQPIPVSSSRLRARQGVEVGVLGGLQ